MTPVRVLVVEDESIVAMDLCNSLEKLGFAVVDRVDRGEDAILRAQKLRPDLVLMDIHLKGSMDGIAAATEIHQRFLLPVIFLTAFTDVETLERAQKSEPFGYILKPFEEHELNATISMALYKHKMEMQLRASEEQFRTLFETMAQGVVYINPAGKITNLNAAARQILGFPECSLQIPLEFGREWRAFHEDGSPFNMEDFPPNLAFSTGKPVASKIIGFALPTRKGIIWLRVFAQPDYLPFEEKPFQVVVTIEDITQLKQVEFNLRASEARFHSVVEHASDGIVIINGQGAIVEWNRSLEKLTGLKKTDAQQKPIWETLYQLYPPKMQTPEEFTEIRDTFSSILHNRELPAENEVMELEILDPAGGIRVLECHSFLVEGVRSVLMASILRDVTIRNQGEAQMRKFTLAVEQSGSAIVITDPQGNIEYVNRRFTTMSGYTLEEVTGQTPRALKSGHHNLEFYQHMWATITSGQTWQGELLNRRKDGSLFWEDASISPVFDAEGNLTHFVAVKEDITARKAIEARESEQRRFTEALLDTAATLNSTLELNPLLDRILENISRVIPNDAATLMLLKNEILTIASQTGNEQLDLESNSGLNISTIQAFPYIQQMLDCSDPLIIADTQASPLWLNQGPALAWVQSYMGAPLCVRGVAIGFLNLYGARANFFTPLHAEILRVFASQSATALENARLYEQTRRLSDTDGLTGLFNSRHFYDLALPAFEHCRQNQIPASIIMMDADLFKDINDRYGHQAGDSVLCEIAALIRQSVRKGDIYARYGGEEFIFLLPESNGEEACRAAERIRASIEKLVCRAEGNAEVRVTISAGVAALSSAHQDLNSLIGAADQALYQAKAEGRNRVALFTPL